MTIKIKYCLKKRKFDVEIFNTCQFLRLNFSVDTVLNTLIKIRIKNEYGNISNSFRFVSSEIRTKYIILLI